MIRCIKHSKWLQISCRIIFFWSLVSYQLGMLCLQCWQINKGCKEPSFLKGVRFCFCFGSRDPKQLKLLKLQNFIKYRLSALVHRRLILYFLALDWCMKIYNQWLQETHLSPACTFFTSPTTLVVASRSNFSKFVFLTAVTSNYRIFQT